MALKGRTRQPGRGRLPLGRNAALGKIVVNCRRGGNRSYAETPRQRRDRAVSVVSGVARNSEIQFAHCSIGAHLDPHDPTGCERQPAWHGVHPHSGRFSEPDGPGFPEILRRQGAVKGCPGARAAYCQLPGLGLLLSLSARCARMDETRAGAGMEAVWQPKGVWAEFLERRSERHDR